MTKKTVKPAEFDFDAWLSGASRPTKSVKVFRRGDLLAELDELADQIERAELVPEEERSLAGSPGKLRAKYADLVEEFGTSALNVRVSALDRDELAEVVLKAKEAGANVASVHEMNHWYLAECATPKLTPEQWKQMAKIIGNAQFDQIVAAVNALSDGRFEPSADFLPKPSTQERAEE